jgi:mannose-6-phosphate isomerase-like protein (cupin superfamily)
MTVDAESRLSAATRHNPAELRIAARELRRVSHLVHQFGDVAAELPGYEPAAVGGIRAARAVIVRLVEQIEQQLTMLDAQAPAPAVQVVDPARRTAAAPAAPGVQVIPTISEPGCGIGSAVVRLLSGQRSQPCAYPDDDVILVVSFGAATVVWWDRHGDRHELLARRHEHALIRRGTRHRLLNTGAVPVVAVHIRTTTADLPGAAFTCLPL